MWGITLIKIKTLQDLYDWRSAENWNDLVRNLYDGTECGAWICVEALQMGSLDSDNPPAEDTNPSGVVLSSIAIGSIVEGSEAEFSETFCLRKGNDYVATTEELDGWVQDLEDLVSEAWGESNSHD
jgi:hypothetical protein